jgi:hypothetical protein
MDWRAGHVERRATTPSSSPHVIQVTTQGEYQVTTSEGVIRRFPVGAVLFVEDKTGAGHSSKITSAEDVIIFAVGLQATART